MLTPVKVKYKTEIYEEIKEHLESKGYKKGHYKILTSKKDQIQSIHYLIKWEDYNKSENSWEPEVSLK